MLPTHPQNPNGKFNDRKVVKKENTQDIKKEKLHDRNSYLPERVLLVTSFQFLHKSWSNLSVAGS